MTSRRSGLAEPSRHIGNKLRMGTVIKVGIPDMSRDVTMMISAIVTLEDGHDNNLYALLTAHSRVSFNATEVRCELIRGPGQARIELGTLMPPAEVLGEGWEKLGFHVLRIEKTPLFRNLRDVAKTIATVKDFRKCLWSPGTFKVRRLNNAAPLETVVSRRGNARLNLANCKGRVAAEIEDVSIPGTEFEYDYCGLVTRGRDRPLAEPRALGAPVISQSGALSAIIVGACGNETLVYPIEELRKGRPIDFVTLGDDWPKVKVASHRKRLRERA